MLDVLGDDYIAQYVHQQVMQEQRERQYRAYITDALMLLTSQEGKLTARWCDLYPAYPVPAGPPDKSENEIRSQLIDFINKEVGLDEPV